MKFRDFVGNRRVREALQRMLQSGRLPSALLLAGPKGVGKFTLASLLARAANCERFEEELCGQCDSCQTLRALDDLPRLRREAVEARGSAKAEEVPLILQPHPNVAVVVPDGAYIRVAQMRYLVQHAYAVPVGRGRMLFLIDEAERLRFDYADVLLKVLEEPPEKTALVLITAAPFELRPTLRSRCIAFHFAPLSRAELERELAEKRPEWSMKERQLGAAVAAGSLGRALRLDLQHYHQVREQAVELLRAAATAKHRPERLFIATAALAAKTPPRTSAEEAEEREPNGFEFSLEVLYALLSDLAYLKAGTPGLELRNPDLRGELEVLGRHISLNWLIQMVRQLDQLEGWQRRNVNRQLALEAMALSRSSLPEEG